MSIARKRLLPATLGSTCIGAVVTALTCGFVFLALKKSGLQHQNLSIAAHPPQEKARFRPAPSN